MDISKSEVKRITELSSIACSEDELSSYMKDLSKIIELFDKLKYVNTDNIEPLYNVIDDNLRLRKDVSIKKNTKKDILKNVPKSKYGFYVVPKMIE
ncbi:Asp-tRNA(Asn)/Glu-tRNA(Gln) amidotransferase subunit GatC [Candidatus Bandiella numerosa]|jgi:aspartyl-tRNA(Asn)/glutamyl-tRNA(Gln) amidotransferase subunit C|uniref:Asp-tRNA(Asn)/Glu-tRNA(Gln) amidotransferase subunit GatC n=1 Tax=Candidatus Bandiella numerosa TaxID=2570586 RepID=UPI00249DCFD6|nr:Asp-tRNA(Asn)/Glu-tRNA(Gln) amidotransferase subunit GatC [Candidatus Bandiella numerosa]WHA04668.1 Asp-tRNA(Asn)/Glu-tRNA(Gln) amidotransferase subunit GatC [Candidatus Bandiella numerosa]